MRIIKRLLLILTAAILCAGGLAGYKGYEKYEKAMGNISLEDKIGEIRNKPSYETLGELPKVYLEAIIAVEDKRFYRHPGIDLISIMRAVKNDIQAGELIEGGSTITQQLAKNLYFGEERSLTRKIAEGILAFRLEKEYTKDEILELYVNSIYFGDGYYCVADASMGYFGKKPDEMTDDECTMLAGIPNAPSVYAPTVNKELAKERQKIVVEAMVRERYLTPEDAGHILNNK